MLVKRQWPGPLGTRPPENGLQLLLGGGSRSGSLAGFFFGGFRGLGDVDHEGVGVSQQDGTRRQDQVRGVDVLACGTAFDVNLDRGGEVGGLGLEGDDGELLVVDVAGASSPVT